jgi:hypothetical protein
MKKDEIDWKTGIVECWNLNGVDLSQPLSDQADELIEDLAQVHYEDKLIDVGWGPSMSPTGSFFVTVVKNQNWETPLLEEKCTTAAALLESIERAVKLAME